MSLHLFKLVAISSRNRSISAAYSFAMRPFVLLATILSLAAANPQGGILDGIKNAASNAASAVDPSKVVGSALSSVGLAVGANQCGDVKLKPGVCAMLFEEDGCRGDSVELKAGAGNLKESDQNKHESVVVAAGASFRGYDDTTGDATEVFSRVFSKNNFKIIENLGKQTILTSFDGKQKAAVIDDLENGPESYHDLEETIESYSCAFGSTSTLSNLNYFFS